MAEATVVSSSTIAVGDAASRGGAWALALGALAASAGTANATPVITVVNGTFPQSISYNGSVQFNIAASTGNAPVMTALNSNLIETNSTPFNASPTAAATKLAAGSTVGPANFVSPNSSGNSTKLKSGAYYVGLDIVSSQAILSGATASGAASNNNYGYAQVNGAVLVLYAFESTPNTPITIPNPVTGVPEPASLAALALGAIGVMGVRRRGRAARA